MRSLIENFRHEWENQLTNRTILDLKGFLTLRVVPPSH